MPSCAYPPHCPLRETLCARKGRTEQGLEEGRGKAERTSERRQQEQSLRSRSPSAAARARTRTHTPRSLVCSRRTYYIDFKPFCCPHKASQDGQVGEVCFL